MLCGPKQTVSTIYLNNCIFFLADRAGKAIQWDISTGEASYFKGPGHGKSKVNILSTLSLIQMLQNN